MLSQTPMTKQFTGPKQSKKAKLQNMHKRHTFLEYNNPLFSRDTMRSKHVKSQKKLDKKPKKGGMYTYIDLDCSDGDRNPEQQSISTMQTNINQAVSKFKIQTLPDLKTTPIKPKNPFCKNADPKFDLSQLSKIARLEASILKIIPDALKNTSKPPKIKSPAKINLFSSPKNLLLEYKDPPKIENNRYSGEVDHDTTVRLSMTDTFDLGFEENEVVNQLGNDDSWEK